MCGVIVAPLGGALVPSIGEPAERGLLALTARLAAVALTSVVGSADHETTGAVTAGQREDIELVHPARMVENWTAISETTTVNYVLARPSIAGTSRAQVWRPGPSLFPPATKYREATCGNATSRIGRPGPGSPVISVEVVPIEAGGDTGERARSGRQPLRIIRRSA